MTNQLSSYIFQGEALSPLQLLLLMKSNHMCPSIFKLFCSTAFQIYLSFWAFDLYDATYHFRWYL